MNRLLLRLSNNEIKKIKNVKMLVFDMAGTTVNEKGIVYDTLYDTIKDFGLNISREDINKWHGANKYEVLNFYLQKDKNKNDEIQNCIEMQLRNNFDNNLKERYLSSSNISLIDEKIPELFNNIRCKDIKITLNTGYSKDIQKYIINKLRMEEFIDNYISSQEVKIGRPFPYMIHELMKKNNIKSSKNVIKFGDTKNDILEGLNANCLSSVGVLSGADCENGLKDATHIIRSVIDIKIN